MEKGPKIRQNYLQSLIALSLKDIGVNSKSKFIYFIVLLIKIKQ